MPLSRPVGTDFLRARPEPSYVGPGDIVSGAAAFYGLRAYNAAYATGANKAINVRRVSDNTTMDILILANGNLDVATATTFLAATTGYITEWYDQTGNGLHMVQATAGSQPQLVLGSPSQVLFSGSQYLLTTFANVPQPYSVVSAVETTSASTNYLFGYNNSSEFGFDSSQVFAYAGANVPEVTFPLSVFEALQIVFNGASSTFNIAGTITTMSATPGTIGISNTANETGLGCGGGPTSPFIGDLGELAVYPAALTSGQQASLHTNLSAYWGTP
jgi:Alpha-L-arabinofuranosidase B, catalytic